jgi:hypothetical protein
MAIEDLPRPWLLAALTGVAGLVRPEDDEVAVERGRSEGAVARPERRRRRLVARQRRDRWYGIDDERPS